MRTKRAYDSSDPEDGARFLVDRLWPRGIKKEELRLDGWLKHLAPSDALRRWFGHDPALWAEFRERYFEELANRAAAIAPILEAARRGNVTLLYGAHDTEHNNAAALKEYVERRLQEAD